LDLKLTTKKREKEKKGTYPPERVMLGGRELQGTYGGLTKKKIK